MNYANKEAVLRTALHGEACVFGTLMPQKDELRGDKLVSDVKPEGGGGHMSDEPREPLSRTSPDHQLNHLRDHSPYQPSYISAVVLQGLRGGIANTQDSIARAANSDIEMGVRELSLSSSKLLTHESRSGHSEHVADHLWFTSNARTT